MNKMTDLSTIQLLKQRLQKVIDQKKDEWEDDAIVDSCKDCLDRLDGVDMTLALLTDTLIGASVAKFKNHPQLGDAAKKLIAKWKEVAKKSEATQPAAAKAKEKGKAIRRESTNSLTDAATKEITEKWSDLPPNRQSICQKLFELLELAKSHLDGMSAEAMQEALAHTAVDVEAAIHDNNDKDRKAYSDKARSIAFNLKKNQQLAVDLIFGSTSPDELVHMSPEQLASADQRQAREEQAKKLTDSRRLDWEVANEAKINEMCGIKGDLLKASLFTCGRCKSTKTTSTQKQTRSADEPMTVFVLCMNCGNRWKC
jgi:transcription elongation factor S-II